MLRPSLSWLLTPATPAGLVADLTRVRDPGDSPPGRGRPSGRVQHAHHAAGVTPDRRHPGRQGRPGRRHHRRRLRGTAATRWRNCGRPRRRRSPYFYQLLHTAGVFPPTPRRSAACGRQGQLSCEQLIDRYGIACRPVRDLLVDYLRERQPGGGLRDPAQAVLQPRQAVLARPGNPPPGIDSLRLPAEVATGWKERITTKTTRSADHDGRISQVPAPRINALDHLLTVRSFYLDITHWATEDPSRWGPWVAPCPIREPEASLQRKKRSHRKSRMDQRTRERLPILPVLITTLNNALTAATDRLHAAQAVAAGDSLHRRRADPAPVTHHPRHGRQDLGRGPRHRQKTRPEPGGTPGVLDVGRGERAAPHRHSDRGTRGTLPPQPHPLQAARHRRTHPAAADRAVQDRHRTAPGDQPRTGRRAQHHHLPGPYRTRRRPTGRGLRLPRTGLEPTDAAAVPTPLRRRAPPHRRTRRPRADQQRPDGSRPHRRQRQTAAVHPPRLPQES